MRHFINGIQSKFNTTSYKSIISTIGMLLFGLFMASCEGPNEVPEQIFNPREVQIDLPDATYLTEDETEQADEIIEEYNNNAL